MNIFKKDFEKIKFKINYLRDKFFEAKSKNTLYIIMINDAIELSIFLKIKSSLEIFRGNKNFLLIMIFNNEKEYCDENAKSFKINNFNLTWEDNNNGVSRLKEILDKFKFSENIWD